MKKVLSLLLIAGLSLVYASSKILTPTAELAESLGIKGIVTAQEAAKLQKDGATIVDCRGRTSYAREKIAGSILAVYKEKGGKKNKIVDFSDKKDKWKDKKISHLKDKVIITYCNGAKCWKSYKCALKAVRTGYKTVYWLRDGIGSWKAAGLPTN